MSQLSTRLLPFLLALVAIAGCQHMTGSAPESRVEVGEPTAYYKASDAEKPENSYFYNYDTIYDLLVAEIALRRGDMDTTLNNYVRQAHFTQNTEIIHRAIVYAEYMNKDDTVLDLALLWTELEPENVFANQIAANQLFKHLRFEEAARHIDILISQGRSPDLENILITAQLMDAEGKMQILSTIRSLTSRHPEQVSLWYTQAILEVENANIPKAVEAIDKVIELDPDNIQAKLIKARTLLNAGSEETSDYLKTVVKEYPDNKLTRLLYAIALEEHGDTDESLRQYQKLVKKFPQDHDLRFSLAVIASSAGEYDLAKTEFMKLVKAGYAETKSLMSLAEIALREGDPETSIAFYEQVTEPGEFINARMNIASVMAEQGRMQEASAMLTNLRLEHPDSEAKLYVAEAQLLLQHDYLDQALNLLNTALKQYPDNANLLYARAMLGDKMDRLDILEQDLMAILERYPDNTMALNALGYTLADKTDRFEEAYQYISKAYALQPNDPAVVDSMGWVEYRMGNTDLARRHLQHAFELSNDHEIAAHYGEILWVTGDRKNALKVWNEALDRTPDSRPLNRAMDRYLPLRNQ